MNFINRRIDGTVATTGRLERRRRARKLVLCAVAPIVAALQPSAGAAVQLSGVASGSASVSHNGSVTSIRTSNNAILNFSQFNIAKGSTVDFLQPSAASRVLDQINSAGPSSINGSLISNGSVYLINPAGVIFGAGATVDVNRFYVAGSHMSDQDFLNGVDHFSGISGMVSNSGQIHANQVYLVGSQVINQGSIVSPNGVVAMLSGSDVVVTEPGSHVSATVVPVISANTAGGSSQKPDLRISALAAGDAYSLAIRHTGSIQASTVLINGGQGQVQVSGSIDASSQTPGTTGGNVSITGGEVDLVSALINASGPAGGGDVQIGGGPHGGGDLAHADIVSVDSASSIDADATNNGVGGTVVLWADSSVTSAGTLDARGGPVGGDGGYIETSAPSLEVSSSPDASSPHGKSGSWVLDPATVEIVLSGGDGTDTVNASSIAASLDGGTSVTLTATGALSQDADAPIAVNSTASSSLILQAGTTMDLSGGISTLAGSSPLSVELDQLGGATGTVAIDTNPININNTFTIVGGSTTLASGIGITASSVTIGTGVPSTGGPSVAGGGVILNSPVTTTGGAFTASGTAFQSTAAISTGAGNVAITNSGVITIEGPITTTGNFSQTGGTSFDSTAAGTIGTGGGNVTIEDATTVLIGGIINTGGGAFTSTGTGFENDVEISDGGVGTSAGAFSVNTSIGSGTVDINGAISWTGGASRSLTIEGGGLVEVTTNGSINGTADLSVALYTTGINNPVNIIGTITTTGPFTSDGGNFNIEAPPIVSPQPPILTALSVTINTVTLTPDAKTVTNGTVTISGPVVTTGTAGAGVFTAGGTVSFISNQTGSITTTDGAVTISNPGLITVGEPIATSGGGFTSTLGNSFTTSNNGTITTGGGNVTITTVSSEGITIGDNINTGGGAFTAVGQSFVESATITNGGVTSSTQSFSVNTISQAANINNITIGEPITWAGTSAASVSIEGGGNITISSTGSITTTGGQVPVSLYTTGASSAITVTGAIDATGAFIAAGGAFTVSAPTVVAPATAPNILTALSVNVNSATLTPDGKTVTNGTVTFAGPVVTTGTSVTDTINQGSVIIGGTVSFISNQFGSITTAGGAVNITNPGLIAVGQPVITDGGDFTSTLGNSFGTANTGTITTGGGNVTLAATTTDEISIGEEVNTGGGSFTATAMGIEITSTITDGGINTANGSFTVNTTSGTDPITSLASAAEISWTGGAGRSVTLMSGGDISFNKIVATGTTPLPISLYTTANSTSTSDSITMSGPISGNGSFVSSGGSFTLSSGANLTATTVDIDTITTLNISSNSTPDNVTLTPGAVSIGAAVSTHGEVTIKGTSFDMPSGGSITTNGGALTVDSSGTVTVEGPVTSQGGAISLTSSAAFTSDSNGAITSSGGDVSIEGATGVTVSAAVNTGGGNFVAAGKTFDNTAEISDGGINDSKIQGLSIIAAAGDITVGAEISWASSLSPITFTVPSGDNIQLGANIVANIAEPINFANIPIVLTSTAADIAGGNISLGALTNVTTGAGALEIDSSGAVSLQAVGTALLPIGQLLVTNNSADPAALPTTTLHGNIFTVGSANPESSAPTSGTDFGGTVILANNIQITNSDPTDTDTVIVEFDGAIEGPGGLTIVVPGDNHGQIRFNDNIGDVTPVAFMNLFPGADELVGFRWGLGQNPPGVGQQQPLTTVNIASGGAFEINNETPPVRNLGFIDLFSTIDSYGPLTINVGSSASPNAANLYAVGQNEKLTVYGDLTLDVNGGTITTGDLSTLGNMTLDASKIRFLLRGSTTSNGTVVDTGMDLIAGGKMSLPNSATYDGVSGSPVAGAFDLPGFIAQSYGSTNIGTISNELKTAFSFVGGISASVLFGPDNLLLDLTPNTLTTSIPTFVPPTPFVFDYGIAGAVPREQVVAGTVPLDFKIAYPPPLPGPILEVDLKDAGIYSQDPDLDEILGGVGTMAVYNDMPDRPRPKSSDYRVVVNRLDPNRVGVYVAEYKQVFGSDPQARKTQMAGDIQGAWDSYVSQNGGQAVSGTAFAQYCAATPSTAAASADLTQLHGLRTQLGSIGLSYKEAQVAFQYNVLAGLSAIGMREGDLATAVVNSSVKH